MGEPGEVRALLDRWRAPWTAEQVAALNAAQADERGHPYTCPGDFACCSDHRALIATRAGWVCRCGSYRQGWAHALAAPPPTAGGPGAGTADGEEK